MIRNAAMLLWYDIVAEQVAEHDEWHTREHFPERVGIPGFLTAQRWVAQGATTPRYLVTYEVDHVGTLTSAAYRVRLDNPSEWTRRMMPHFRGMVRGFCEVTHRIGSVVGGNVLTIRYVARPQHRASLARWIGDECLPRVAQLRGFASACTLVAAATPPMTEEQALRGRDIAVDSVVLVSTHAAAPLDELQDRLLAPRELETRGADDGIACGRYRFACRADSPGA